MSQVNEQDESWRGKIGKLDQQELDGFLSTGTIARLACLDANGWPYIVPCWHEWDGSAFWVVAREKSKWALYLAQNERAAITVDEAGTQRKVVAQCRATIVEEPNVGGNWVPVAERMSVRYLGKNGPKYLQPTMDKARWLIRLDPLTMQTWQGVEWADRYH